MKKIFETKIFIKTVDLMDIINEIPAEISWSDIKIIPVFVISDVGNLTEMVGFKAVAYNKE